jgi:hypothetical protein
MWLDAFSTCFRLQGKGSKRKPHCAGIFISETSGLLDWEKRCYRAWLTAQLTLEDFMERKLLWKITKLIKLPRKPTTIQITRDKKQVKNVKYFESLSSMINVASCTREINPGLPWQRWTRRDHFHKQIWTEIQRRKYQNDAFGMYLCLMLKPGNFRK